MNYQIRTTNDISRGEYVPVGDEILTEDEYLEMEARALREFYAEFDRLYEQLREEEEELERGA